MIHNNDENLLEGNIKLIIYLFLGFDFFECSAKDNINVSAAFDR